VSTGSDAARGRIALAGTFGAHVDRDFPAAAARRPNDGEKERSDDSARPGVTHRDLAMLSSVLVSSERGSDLRSTDPCSAAACVSDEATQKSASVSWR
jgi:hypothetical protein